MTESFFYSQTQNSQNIKFMEPTIPSNSSRRQVVHECSEFHNDSLFNRNPILILNENLDNLSVPHGVNEQTIEYFLQNLEGNGMTMQPVYWLTLARLFELSLICAGNYADNCEFSAAGDLLVNPRKVLIHRKGYPHPSVKHRHGRLSEQLNKNKKSRELFLFEVKHEVKLGIAEPAILPYLFEQMERSRQIASWYLYDSQEGMKKIADTIGFLSAWSVSRFGELQDRKKKMSLESGCFVKDHLCRFDASRFQHLGREITRLIDNSSGNSKFLSNQTL